MITVFTNGCFDCLHPGHVRLLKWARSLGQQLIVGLNSDDSVRSLKGPQRPVYCLSDRLEMLLALKFVEQVVVFYDATPEDLIRRIRPDILVKGPEHRHSIVPGAEFVLSYGGKVLFPDWQRQHSTSQVIEKIQSLGTLS
jgi:D-beta-D-heptose 7-phosphate kinase/D-beta-D-heptose 1-phosphate adenosyltransferase